ncbi:MAG: hypothetical protein AAF211_27485, partial [Myxococcota bacterium]
GPVLVVDAHEALLARSRGDDLAPSGLTALQNRLSELLPVLRRRVFDRVGEAAAAAVRYGIERCDEHLSDLSGEQDAARKELEAERDAMNARLRDVERRVKQITDRATDFGRTNASRIAAWGRSATGRLRNHGRTLLQQGITDGVRLDDALARYQRDELNALRIEIQDEVFLLVSELRDTLPELLGWQPPQVDPSVPRREGRAKFEDHAPTAGNAVGGMLGGFTAGAAGGAVAGPVGAVIGGVLGGLVGAAAGHGSGRLLQAGVRQVRAKVAARDVLLAIDDFVRAATARYSASIQQFRGDLVRELDSWGRSRRAASEARFRERKLALDASGPRREALRTAWSGRREALRAALSGDG